MKEISKEAAIKIYESGIYNEMTDIQIVEFQLFQRFLAVPFQVFQDALSRVLRRDVYKHEFANAEALQKEFLGEKDAPTFEEIIAPIKDKVTFIL
jgi:hypothetical protein